MAKMRGTDGFERTLVDESALDAVSGGREMGFDPDWREMRQGGFSPMTPPNEFSQGSDFNHPAPTGPTDQNPFRAEQSTAVDQMGNSMGFPESNGGNFDGGGGD